MDRKGAVIRIGFDNLAAAAAPFGQLSQISTSPVTLWRMTLSLKSRRLIRHESLASSMPSMRSTISGKSGSVQIPPTASQPFTPVPS